MFAALLNPFTMIVGGALVLTPIIIHLINRIRFRRVKWAAMEFLLKAQKKQKRKKILEQLILLLLRCVLVFLVGLLLARYIGGCTPGEQSKQTQPTTHVILLDDTPSMADGWRPEGGGSPTDALAEGKRLVSEKLVPATAEAQSAQTVQVIRLSDLELVFPEPVRESDGKKVPKAPEELREDARVNGKSIAALQEALRVQVPVSVVRRPLLDGLKRAKELAEQAPAGDARLVHVVSDLRAIDWAAEGPAIQELLREFKDGGIAVHLIDVANPVRKTDRKNPPFSDNLSIVEVRPLSRIVSVGQPTQIEVRVRNYGVGDLRDVGVDFYLNGQRDLIQTVSIPHLPANQERTASTTYRFQEITDPDARAKLGPLHRFRFVTAVLSNPGGGIAVDNARHMVVEVRDSLKVLVVDGRTVVNGVDLRESPKGDSAFLRTMLSSQKPDDDEYLGKIDIVSGNFGQLDKIDLRPYSAVYLMNVPALTEAGVKNLESFVEGGGGVGVFLGPDVKADEYNARMYRGGAGFFPVPLADQPSKELTDEQRLIRTFTLAPRLMLRNTALRTTHPAIKGMYTDARDQPVKDNKVEQQFRLPLIDQYWPVRRGAWREDKSVQELFCLPNEDPIGRYEADAVELVTAIRGRIGEPKFEKARKYLDPLLDKIKRTPTSPLPLSELARLMDDLLCDQVSVGDESEPVLREFWAQPELTALRAQAADLRDRTKFGPPLYVVKQKGRGRVVLMTTDASGTYAGDKRWNDWASGQGGSGWSILVAQMQKYLAGGGDDANRSVGDPFTAEFDPARYQQTATAVRITADPTKPTADRKIPWDVKALGQVDLDNGTRVADAAPDAPPPPLKLTYADTKVPGAYLFTLTRKKTQAGPAPGGAPDPLGDLDFVGGTFNVDALNEGDLRRANTDDLAALTNKAPLHNTEDLSWIDDLKQKPTDLSSRRWLYLMILLVLVAEQAWAVRTSYHNKPEDLDLLAPSAAAAFAPRTVATPAAAEAGEPVGSS
jgi:hypothetical protein